ncbi:MAG: hypothetical protein ABFD75_10865 [Smithella sp.]
MRFSFIVFVFILLLASVSHAFEIDGLKSGISMDEAKKLLESFSYKTIEVKDNSMIASDEPRGSGRFIALCFCKGKLVQAQKHLKPRFDYFVRLVSEKRRELGKPTAAWTQPTDVTSSYESNSVSFRWKDGQTFIKVTYSEYGSNNQLDILYEIKNLCW